MKNKLITIDIDNVLCDTARAFMIYYAEKYGDIVQYDDILHAYIQDNPCFEKFDKTPWLEREYAEFFGWASDQDKFSPCRWAVHTVWQLKDLWYTLHAVSGRWDDQYEFTDRRLGEYFSGMFDGIHLMNDHSPKAESKGDACKRLWALVHLDDFHHYAETVASVWIPTLLFETPRNESYKNDDPLIVRIWWWHEVMENINKL